MYMGATYKKNFLKNVICKVDFTEQPKYDQAKLKDFQKLIKKEFPILQEAKGLVIEAASSERIDSKAGEFIKWIFFNKTKTRIVSFESNYILLEFKEYDNFEEFFQIFELIIDSWFNVFPSIISIRLGLRYMNQIELSNKEPLEWKGLINKLLLESFKFVKDKENLARHMNLIEINKGDYLLKFRYGIANSVYPSPIIKKEFILDYDCFTSESLDKSEILIKVKEFNGIITDLFEQSIEAGLRKIMGETKEEAIKEEINDIMGGVEHE